MKKKLLYLVLVLFAVMFALAPFVVAALGDGKYDCVEVEHKCELDDKVNAYADYVYGGFVPCSEFWKHGNPLTTEELIMAWELFAKENRVRSSCEFVYEGFQAFVREWNNQNPLEIPEEMLYQWDPSYSFHYSERDHDGVYRFSSSCRDEFNEFYNFPQTFLDVLEARDELFNLASDLWFEEQKNLYALYLHESFAFFLHEQYGVEIGIGDIYVSSTNRCPRCNSMTSDATYDSQWGPGVHYCVFNLTRVIRRCLAVANNCGWSELIHLALVHKPRYATRML